MTLHWDLVVLRPWTLDIRDYTIFWGLLQVELWGTKQGGSRTRGGLRALARQRASQDDSLFLAAR